MTGDFIPYFREKAALLKCHRQQARFLDIFVTLCQHLMPLVRPPRNTYTMSSPYTLPMSPPHQALLTSFSYTPSPLRQRSSIQLGTALQTWSSRCCLRATPMPATPLPSPHPPPPSAPTSLPGRSCASTASATWCRCVTNLMVQMRWQPRRRVPHTCPQSRREPSPSSFPYRIHHPNKIFPRSLLLPPSLPREVLVLGEQPVNPTYTSSPLPLCFSGGPGPGRAAGGSHPGAADRHAEGPHGAADRLLRQLPRPPGGRVRRDAVRWSGLGEAISVLFTLPRPPGGFNNLSEFEFMRTFRGVFLLGL